MSFPKKKKKERGDQFRRTEIGERTAKKKWLVSFSDSQNNMDLCLVMYRIVQAFMISF